MVTTHPGKSHGTRSRFELRLTVAGRGCNRVDSGVGDVCRCWLESDSEQSGKSLSTASSDGSIDGKDAILDSVSVGLSNC